MEHDDSMRDLSALLSRATLGAAIAAHGAQKLYGWFDGPGIEGTTGMMGTLGFDPPERYARLSALTEIAAGTLIASGTLGPVGPALLASVMTTAVGSVHLKNGFWNKDQGFELNTMYGLAALLLAANGYGRPSVDQITGLRGKTTPLLGVLAIAGGVGGAVFMLSRRRARPPAEESMKQASSRTPSETGTVERQHARET
ncbi:MAG: DoxX family protein [Candidatus Baltobacteraceae bacterium]